MAQTSRTLYRPIPWFSTRSPRRDDEIDLYSSGSSWNRLRRQRRALESLRRTADVGRETGARC